MIVVAIGGAPALLGAPGAGAGAAGAVITVVEMRGADRRCLLLRVAVAGPALEALLCEAMGGPALEALLEMVATVVEIRGAVLALALALALAFALACLALSAELLQPLQPPHSPKQGLSDIILPQNSSSS